MPVSDQHVSLERYMLIPRTLIFLTQNEQVLLIKGSPHKRLWANLYNGIGGHVEKGEGIFQSARRELLEETGLQAENLYLVGTIVLDTGENPGIIIFVYRGDTPTGKPITSPEGNLAWVPIQQALSLPLVEDLYTLLPKVLETRSDMPLFSGFYEYENEKLVIRFDQ